MNAINLVDRLLETYAPDMLRIDDAAIVRESAGGNGGVQRACYSETRLLEMLNDCFLVGRICKAHEGYPMWRESVRTYLVATLTEKEES